MTPNLTDMVPEALAAQQGGADAVSAVNTFKSISHVGLDYTGVDGAAHYQPQPNIEGYSAISGFSGQACRPMALRFIAEMAQDSRLTIPLSGMGGIYTWHDAVEFMSLGASNLQCTTSVMHHGIHIVEDLKDGLLRHLRRLGHDNVSEIVGAGLPYIQPPEKLDLKTEAVSTIVPELCIGCGACVRSCRDGAVDAIQLVDGVARADPHKCVGCSLCTHVCPVQGAVQMTTRPRIERC
jgi:dihydropyrimidine dehydrogenase (NAD+) subunit PreA